MTILYIKKQEDLSNFDRLNAKPPFQEANLAIFEEVRKDFSNYTFLDTFCLFNYFEFSLCSRPQQHVTKRELESDST